MKTLIHDLLHRFFPRLWFGAKYRVENEYQEFVYSKRELVPYGSTMEKLRTLWPVFQQVVQAKSFLELGCDTGFFPLQAAIMGARRAVGVDRNVRALKKAEKVRRTLGLEQVEFKHATIPHIDVSERFDTVLFMSTIHYMFSDSLGTKGSFRTMEQLTEYLSGYVRHSLLIEFVRPEDSMAQRLVKARILSSGEYSERALITSLRHRYPSVDDLGSTHTPTRHLYHARR